MRKTPSFGILDVKALEGDPGSYVEDISYVEDMRAFGQSGGFGASV